MVNPCEQERFALRLILLHAKGARSFEELRTVNGHTHNTFMEAARAMNLLHNDEEYRLTLNEVQVLHHFFSSEVALPIPRLVFQLTFMVMISSLKSTQARRKQMCFVHAA